MTTQESYEEIKRIAHEAIKPEDFLPNNSKAFLCILDVLAMYLLFFLTIGYLDHFLKNFIAPIMALRIFNCVAQINHMCGHSCFTERIRPNYVIGRFTGWLLGYQFDGKRTIHSHHHHYLNQDKDGDKVFGRTDQTPRQFLLDILLDLLGWRAIVRSSQYIQKKKHGTSTVSRFSFIDSWVNFFPIFLTQSAVFAACAVVAGPFGYFIYYLVPLATIYPAVIRIRSLAEHLGLPWSAEREHWISRTTLPNIVERAVIAPFGQNYHLEHHLFPTIALYHSEKIHRTLYEHLPNPPQCNRSYIGYALKFLSNRESQNNQNSEFRNAA